MKILQEHPYFLGSGYATELQQINKKNLEVRTFKIICKYRLCGPHKDICPRMYWEARIL